MTNDKKDQIKDEIKDEIMELLTNRYEPIKGVPTLYYLIAGLDRSTFFEKTLDKIWYFLKVIHKIFLLRKISYIYYNSFLKFCYLTTVRIKIANYKIRNIYRERNGRIHFYLFSVDNVKIEVINQWLSEDNEATLELFIRELFQFFYRSIDIVVPKMKSFHDDPITLLELSYFSYSYRKKENPDEVYETKELIEGETPFYVDIWHPDESIGFTTLESAVSLLIEQLYGIKDCEVEVLRNVTYEEIAEIYNPDRNISYEFSEEVIEEIMEKTGKSREKALELLENSASIG